MIHSKNARYILGRIDTVYDWAISQQVTQEQLKDSLSTIWASDSYRKLTRYERGWVDCTQEMYRTRIQRSQEWMHWQKCGDDLYKLIPSKSARIDYQALSGGCHIWQGTWHPTDRFNSLGKSTNSLATKFARDNEKPNLLNNAEEGAQSRGLHAVNNAMLDRIPGARANFKDLPVGTEYYELDHVLYGKVGIVDLLDYRVGFVKTGPRSYTRTWAGGRESAESEQVGVPGSCAGRTFTCLRGCRREHRDCHDYQVAGGCRRVLCPVR